MINHYSFHDFRVVKSVLAKEETQLGENEWIQPSNDERGDSDNDDILKTEPKRVFTRQPSFDMSIKTGGTHIMNPKNKKRMETCLIEKDDSDRLQSILANETDDVDAQNWIQPGSTTEEGDDTGEIERTSMLHDFKESIAETLHHLHLPHHHPDQPKSEIKDKHGLLEAAMENMLMEQAGMMGAHAKGPCEATKFEDKRNSSIESFKKLLAAPFRRRSNDSVDLKPPPKKVHEPKKEKVGLFDTAMKTMLIETAHIIEGVGVHPKSFDDGDKMEIKPPTSTTETKTEAEPMEIIVEDKPNIILPADETETTGETKKSSESYSNFCNKLTSSHILTNANPNESMPSPVTAGNKQSNEMPVLVLTHCASNSEMIKSSDVASMNQQIGENDKKNLSPNICHDRVSIDNTDKRSPKPMRKSNHTNLIRSKSSNSINKTNKTKMLAHDPHLKLHRSTTDDKQSADISNGEKSESMTGTKIQQISPTKVTTSSSSYNTATNSTAATTNLSSSKDGKDNKETICRRSSDSDLSVTPKGNLPMHFVFRESKNKKNKQ